MKVETTVFQFTIKCNNVYKEARCIIKTLSLNYVICFINDITVTIIVDTDYHCTSRNVV